MEYSIEFGERLIEAADSFVTKSSPGDEVGRTVLYLSLLSCEVSLKALLEKAGFSVQELKNRSHNLSGLAKDICCCELTGTGIGNSKPFSAARLLSQEVIPNTSNGTVGTLLKAESIGASKYPNDIRYGELITHFPPLVMLSCAKVVSNWAKEKNKLHQAKIMYNYAINADSEKRRSFVAPLFTAGYGERYVP